MPDQPIDIPFKAPSVEAHMQETHVRFELTPNNDPMLAFDLLVPKTWGYSAEFGPVNQTLLLPQGLGFFMQSAERGAPVIGVTVTRCPFEIALEVFARQRVIAEGWTLVASDWFPGPKGMFYDLTARKVVEGDLELIRRTTMRIDQGRIFAVNCMCARKYWDAVKESFWAAHVTFELLKGSGDETCEAWRPAFGKQPDFQISYPASWSAEPAESNSDDRSGVHLRLTDPDQTRLLAYILVQADRRHNVVEPSLRQLVQETSEVVEKSGVKLISEPRPIPEREDPRSPTVDGWLAGCTFSAQLGTDEIVLRYGFVVRPHVIFTLVVMSPKLEDDTLSFARTQRTFEIARGTLQAVEQ